MQRAGLRSWAVVLSACAIVAVAAAADAQGTAASIQGVIVDETGPLPGATIVRLPQSQHASVAFEGFNIFNSTNFGCYNGEIPVLPATNPPSCTVDNTSRRLQLGVRYAF
jgi:hypothetical protein